MKTRIKLPKQEYRQKRYEVSKSTMASVISKEGIEFATDSKQRESFIFNCVLLADSLLEELGYFEEGSPESAHGEETSIKRLSDILGSEKI